MGPTRLSMSQASAYGIQSPVLRPGGSTSLSANAMGMSSSGVPLASSSSSRFGVGVRSQPGGTGIPAKESRQTRASRLSVVVRKRPMNRGEAEGRQQDVVICRNSAVIVREPKLKVDLTRYVEEHNFLFDQSFDETVTNEQLYESCVRPIIDAVFKGAKCTCFAYGQTGSGKTFTMMGPPKRLVEGVPEKDRTPGIFLLAAQDIFRSLNAKEHTHLGIYIAFYEIYCGKLFDLLNNRQILHARENAKSNVIIVGLQEHSVQNVQELMEVIEFGLNSRTTGQTGANVDSSRSHAILQITLRDLQVQEEGKFKEHGKISFIDLAGSERGADTLDTDRQTRMDGAEINKSLLALKECIRALDQQLDHTPFRGSKLTQVLKDSFVGSNCRTVMIANVSPCSQSCEHTLNTLRYAYRVKELRSTRFGAAGSSGGDSSGPYTDYAPVGNAQGELVDDDSTEEESQTPPRRQPARPHSAAAHRSQEEHVVEQPHHHRPASVAATSSHGSHHHGSSTHTSRRPPDEVKHAIGAEVSAVPPQRPVAGGAPSHGTVGITGAAQIPHVSAVTDPQAMGFLGMGEHAPAAKSASGPSSQSTTAPGPPDRGQDASPQSGAGCSQATLDELARQHDRLIGTILAEEEELIQAHRQHIDRMVELIKEEMVHLNNVDRPGSDVDAYVAGLDRILRLKADYIGDIQQKVDVFKEHLLQEDTLSRKFQSLASAS